MQIQGFDWDAGNREKCQKHGVSLDEIEELFRDHDPMIFPDHANSTHEVRTRAIGKLFSGRWLFVAYTLRHGFGRPFIRPISARYMHRKEVVFYENLDT